MRGCGIQETMHSNQTSARIGLLGSVPDDIRSILQASGWDVGDQREADVIVAHARGDWPTFPIGSTVIAVCDTTDDVASAYRAGAWFATSADPSVVKLLVERALESKGIRSLANLERDAILAAM